MLSLAVLCAFHYFLADISGRNLFLSRVFLHFLSFPFLKPMTSFCLKFTSCLGIPVVRDYNGKIVAFSLGLQKEARGHRTDSLPNFNACHAKGQRVGKTLKQEEPIFPSGCLAQYIGGSTEKRLPMPDKREGTDYFLNWKMQETRD